MTCVRARLHWSRRVRAGARSRACSTSPLRQQCVGSTCGRRQAASKINPALATAVAAQGARGLLLHLVAKEPDLTLEEIRKRLRREKKLGVAVSSVWRFYDRHEITFKKKSSMRVSRIGLTSRPRERR